MAFVNRILDYGSAFWHQSSVDQAQAYRRDKFWGLKVNSPQTVALCEAIVAAISFAPADADTLQNKGIKIELSSPLRRTSGAFSFDFTRNERVRDKFKEALLGTAFRFTNEYRVVVTTYTLDKREDNAQSKIVEKVDTFVIQNGGFLRATTLNHTSKEGTSQEYSRKNLQSNHFSKEVIDAFVEPVVIEEASATLPDNIQLEEPDIKFSYADKAAMMVSDCTKTCGSVATCARVFFVLNSAAAFMAAYIYIANSYGEAYKLHPAL